MKKKSCLTLAIILMMAQVISLFAVLPAMATGASKNYSLIKTTETMTIDGKADEAVWSKADWSSHFVAVGGNHTTDSFTAQFKAVWEPAENGKMNVYIFVVARGQDVAGWWRNNIRIQIGNMEGTRYFWSGQRQLDAHIISNTNKPNFANGNSVGDLDISYKLDAVNNIGSSKIATYEFCYQVDKADSFKFDIMVEAGFNSGGWKYVQYSWANMTESTYSTAAGGAGIGTVLDTTDEVHRININKASQNITIDGNADEDAWLLADSSENFANMGVYSVDGFTGHFKALWSPVEGDDTKMNLYLLIVATGHLTGKNDNWRNHVRVQIESADGTQRFWSGQKQLTAHIVNNANKPNLSGSSFGGFGATMQADAVNAISESGTATYEICYQLNKADSIKLDVLVGACSNEWTQAECSWAGMTGVTNGIECATGVGIIVDDEPEGIALTMTEGASIRVDTTNPTMSGIRFESTVNMDQYNALVAQGTTVTTGTLIVPTNSLTAKEIADADFTKETLIAKGFVENTHFYDIVNEGNEWVEGKEGTWYATLYDLKNFNRLFSAVAYVTVELNGDSVTYYAQYQSGNARSIAEVAERVMKNEIEGDEGNWTAAQEAVLKSFYAKETQS